VLSSFPQVFAHSEILIICKRGGLSRELDISPEFPYQILNLVFCSYGGAYAEYIAVNTHMLLHKPHHLNWDEAAGVPEVSLGFGIFCGSNMRANIAIDLDYSDSGYVSCWRF